MGPHCAPDLPERGATRSRQRAACMRHEITDEQEGPHGPMTRCGQAASARCHISLLEDNNALAQRGIALSPRALA